MHRLAPILAPRLAPILAAILAPAAIAMLLAVPAMGVQAQETGMTKAGVAAAEKWLALVDEGKIAESWNEAAATLKRQVPQDQWIGGVQQARAAYGAPGARKLVAAQYTTSLPNAPKGEYVVIQYQSAFANGAVVETVIPAREADGSWKVSGYFLK